MQPLWKAAGVPNEDAACLAERLGLPTRVARWLLARNIVGEDEARRFLFAREAWTDPFDFLDMRGAVDRILAAVRDREQIVIVGDYDVDGVTASAILASELEARGAHWHCIIPERVADGYGLAPPLVERAHQLGGTLIVTVDNGIRAQAALEAAGKIDIDVIVTDHHEPVDELLTSAFAVVHYSRHADPERARALSGAGVAWKLTQAMQAVDPRRPGSTPAQFHEAWLMGLAALGAVSDMMPMRGENRRLVREGLMALRSCQRPGWLLLCERARVDVSKLSVSDISWRIGPRVNAAGRMAHAGTAFSLLMAEQRSQAADLADEIERLNVQRRQATERATQEAIAQVESIYGPSPDAVVACGEWPLGVVGIVAAKLVNHFGCPAIALAQMEDGLLRGSGRAPAGISLHSAVALCAPYLSHFGGHDAAIGCGLQMTHLADFRIAFARAVADLRAETRDVDAVSSENMIADDYLPLSEHGLELLDWAQRFAPFGPENEPLQLFVGPVEVRQATKLGNGSHLRLRLVEGGVEQDAVWFQVPPLAAARLESGLPQVCAFLVEIEENVWQGRRTAQLLVRRGWVLDARCCDRASPQCIGCCGRESRGYKLCFMLCAIAAKSVRHRNLPRFWRHLSNWDLPLSAMVRIMS
ncbi:single-stranded-DNA-specific exonuclease RecJ [Alicyclobacillus sacchari]|uniref:single-stranded-DNA-specific exonuclease RecJ n=1 Tax=Alicyclobacillus sacchari TaxID=392010 RepID=UPI0023E934F8|nr:single-stranded-DNA-specific exonuclease RecJ [Alicyclobacillus sacchari]GMA56270.1 single-stranded-DNA-specific exonuclease RecJ [Alicyclobacillus sacchari]